MVSAHSSYQYTKGGVAGHWLRRAIHLSMVVIPIIYYFWGRTVAHAWHIRDWALVLIFLDVVLLYEIARLFFGSIALGQREHERYHMSSFAWGAIGIAIALIAAGPLAIAIVAGCAFGDPLLGELRQAKLPKLAVAAIGFTVIALLWWLCGVWLPLGYWWLPLVMSFTAVIAEYPCWTWIDDNALMMIAPTVVLLLIQ